MLTEKTSQSRVDQLRELLEILAQAIDSQPGMRDLASLARQYRETLAELAELGAGEEHDEIADILEGRKAAGKPKPVRADRTGL